MKPEPLKDKILCYIETDCWDEGGKLPKGFNAKDVKSAVEWLKQEQDNLFIELIGKIQFNIKLLSDKQATLVNSTLHDYDVKRRKKQDEAFQDLKDKIKIKCAMCGKETKVINHPKLDLKDVICKNHKTEDIVEFMLKEK